MTRIGLKPKLRRKRGAGSSSYGGGSPRVFCLVFVLVLYVATRSVPTENTEHAGELSSSRHLFQYNVSYVRQKLSDVAKIKRRQIAAALQHLNSGNLPTRLQGLRDKHQVVGEHLVHVKAGTKTVQELLHGHDMTHHSSNKPPMDVKEVVLYLDKWIHTLHETLAHYRRGTFDQIWQAYHDLTVKTLYPWDQDYLSRMSSPRTDGSIFLSIATYRDENCFSTLSGAYGKAKYPEKLFVGLVQQNCHTNCRSGVLKNLKMEDVPPDDDCYQLFCNSDVGKPICAQSQVRVLNIDEPESLGPYAARYFASKLWFGEEWFMQIDAHMTFATHWDATTIEMLGNAPSERPVLSHYPPEHTVDLDRTSNESAGRLCGPMFSPHDDLGAQIVRLEGAGWDEEKLEHPGFAPFAAAGFFVAPSSFLKVIPFDPFLPWIFMGEEIILSSRLWTAGYDIFSPTTSVVGHVYERAHKPKFWESVHRAFSMGVHNPLQALVLDRIKHQLGYPESARDMLRVRSVLTAVEQYGMGKARPLDAYLRLIGLNVRSKEVTETEWCEGGFPPPGFEKYYPLYPEGRKRLQRNVAGLGGSA